MLRYLVRRLIWAFVLFVAVTIVTYVIFYAIPADPARLACGQRATAECIKRAAHYLGTDRPLYVQYGKFFGRLMPVSVSGGPHFKTPSLGRSFTNRLTVNYVVINAAPVTASLVFGGAVFWMLIALPVGILSALRPRSLLDRIAMVFVLIGISAHPVWIGLLLAYFLGFKAGIFPITGYCDLINPSGDCGGPVQWAYHLILPWATFAFLFSALYVRMIRANVMEALGDDYVRTARAKGAPEWLVMRSHVLRNALLPVLTSLGLQVPILVGSAAVTETVFSWPGMGRLSVEAALGRDYPLVMGITLLYGALLILFNIATDLARGWLDPKVRRDG